MSIAICFIGTGQYLNFLPKYYENIHKNFLPNTDKTFLVFTDGEGDFPEDVKYYHQAHIDWPFITLNRFNIIDRARDEIQKHDWFVFLDADTLVVNPVTEDEFFTDKPLFGVHHPCHYLKFPPHTEYPGAFETYPLSEAAIDETYDTSVYYQGCLWGGKVPEVLDLIENLKNAVQRDTDNNIMAVWHDESHLNKYFIGHKDQVNVLHPQYAYPELFSDYCDFEPKIVHLAKNNSQYHK